MDPKTPLMGACRPVAVRLYFPRYQQSVWMKVAKLDIILAGAIALLLVVQARASRSGASIYAEMCASCHGAKGQGVADKHDEPLYGERSVESLARLIEKTMPEDDPGKCVGEDAKAVAEYIFEEFYSLRARARNNPPKVQLTRLTNRQYCESVADLIGSFRPAPPAPRIGGLAAEYFQSKGMNKKDKKIFERVDETVDFDF